MLPRMRRDDLDADLNDLTNLVLEAAIHVHKTLGPGLLEKVYVLCLLDELQARGLRVAPEVPVPLRYGERVVGTAFRIDLLVEERLVIEVKAVPRFHPVHVAQILTYLRLTGHPAGLLLNYHAFPLAIRRFVNTPSE